MNHDANGRPSNSPSPSPSPFATPIAPPKKKTAADGTKYSKSLSSMTNSALAALSALSASPPPSFPSPSPTSNAIPSNRQSPSLLPPKKMQKNFNINNTASPPAIVITTPGLSPSPTLSTPQKSSTVGPDGTSKRKRVKDGADGVTKKAPRKSKESPDRLKLQKVLLAIQSNDVKKWKLELTGVDLSDKTGYVPLAEALRNNSSVTVLYLANTKLTADGAGAIAEALKTNKTLIEISFWNCPVGVEGAKRLAEMLEVNNTLSMLWMSSCKIGDEGACVLAKSMKANRSLSHLYLANNDIGEEGAKSLASAVILPTSKMVSLNLVNNPRVSTKTIDSVDQLLAQWSSKSNQSTLFYKLFGAIEGSTSLTTSNTLVSKSPSPSPS